MASFAIQGINSPVSFFPELALHTLTYIDIAFHYTHCFIFHASLLGHELGALAGGGGGAHGTLGDLIQLPLQIGDAGPGAGRSGVGLIQLQACRPGLHVDISNLIHELEDTGLRVVSNALGFSELQLSENALPSCRCHP